MTETIAAVLQVPDALDVARDIVGRFPSLRELQQATDVELQQLPGVGPAASARLQAALELGRRMLLEPAIDRTSITQPSDVAALTQGMIGGDEQESLLAILLDARHRIIKTEIVYRGTLNASYIRPADIMRLAVRHNAASLIIAHNHPSGDPTPSPDDLHVTKTMAAAAQLLGIELLDHIVVGHNCHVSMKERGLGFE